MGNIKTKPMSGEHRVITGQLKLLERTNDYLFPVELWLLNDQVNRNGWKYERLEQNMRKFLGKPILVAYVNGGQTIGDGHNFRDETDRNGDPAPSFTDATAERIVGVMSEKKDDVRTEERDGKLWVVGRGTLWAWYAKELVEKIERDAVQGRAMSVSIETLVTKSHMDGEVEVEEEYMILGATILGDHVRPAVAGARITALSALEREFRELKMRAASYRNTPKTNEKGMNKLSIFSKTQRDSLAEKFNGWRVLEAVETESGSILVALCNDKLEFGRYELKSLSDDVIEKQIVSCAARVDFGIGTDVDVSPLFVEQQAEIARLNEALDATKKTVEERDNQIRQRDEIENKRRVKEAKAIAERTLAAFNANRSEKVAESEISAICGEIECGKYTAMVGADGLWCGDMAVENAVYAVCARAVQKSDEAEAERNRSTYAYDKFRAESTNDGGVAGVLSRLGIR